MRPVVYLPWPIALVVGLAMLVVAPVWFLGKLVWEVVDELRRGEPRC